MRSYQTATFSLLLLSSSLTFASTETTVRISSQQDMVVHLQRYFLTSKQREALAARARSKLLTSTISLNPIMTTEKQLGMNNVPVLDQGGYGSCVTFANIAATDALLAPEDYISEWCNLTLGQYLEEHSKYYQSGWDGSFGEIVLNQMHYYGVIPKSQENTIRCGDVDSYSSAGATKVSMSLADYNQYSQPLADISWVPILSYVEGFYFKTKKMTEILNQVRATLRSGDRMTLGFLIDEHQIFVGAEGKYHTSGDTWVMTPEIENHLLDGNVNAGHELIITGFNDEALVYDQHSIAHQGLFTLRNSWGEYAGDHGDYYMTYDYFLLMAVEVQRIFKMEI